jgi:hypothetical protein
VTARVAVSHHPNRPQEPCRRTTVLAVGRVSVVDSVVQQVMLWIVHGECLVSRCTLASGVAQLLPLWCFALLQWWMRRRPEDMASSRYPSSSYGQGVNRGNGASRVGGALLSCGTSIINRRAVHVTRTMLSPHMTCQTQHQGLMVSWYGSMGAHRSDHRGGHQGATTIGLGRRIGTCTRRTTTGRSPHYPTRSRCSRR